MGEAPVDTNPDHAHQKEDHQIWSRFLLAGRGGRILRDHERAIPVDRSENDGHHASALRFRNIPTSLNHEQRRLVQASAMALESLPLSRLHSPAIAVNNANATSSSR